AGVARERRAEDAAVVRAGAGVAAVDRRERFARVVDLPVVEALREAGVGRWRAAGVEDAGVGGAVDEADRLAGARVATVAFGERVAHGVREAVEDAAAGAGVRRRDRAAVDAAGELGAVDDAGRVAGAGVAPVARGERLADRVRDALVQAAGRAAVGRARERRAEDAAVR